MIISSYIQAGFKTVLLSSCIAGEAKKVGELYAALTERNKIFLSVTSMQYIYFYIF